MNEQLKERADFHVHLGDRTAQDLITEAVEQNTRTIAVMDRGNTRASKLKEVMEVGRSEGALIIPGIESFTKYKDVMFELIGLDFDLDHPEIQRAFSSDGEVNIAKHCQKVEFQTRFLREQGFLLEHNDQNEPQWQAINERALDTAYRLSKIVSLTPNNAGLFKELEDELQLHLEKYPYHAGDLKAKFLYGKYFAAGKPGFRQWFQDYKTIIDAIHAGSGVVIIAHPEFTHTPNAPKITTYIEELFDEGADGLEGWYGTLNGDQLNISLAERAQARGKLVLGGSGRDTSYNNTRIGIGEIPAGRLYIPPTTFLDIQKYKK